MTSSLVPDYVEASTASAAARRQERAFDLRTSKRLTGKRDEGADPHTTVGSGQHSTGPA